ncbi:cytochrome c oxidase assembly protein [Micromonospora aurantiaca]|nr:cytochrome c oxidase assembly protein [Micromonospora aurantiaca]
MLGFPMPAAPSAGNLLGQPLPDMFVLAVVAFSGAGYLAGLRRVRRSGRPGCSSAPLVGSLAWSCSPGSPVLGVACYAHVLFSMHMALATLVPTLLVGGAPITLALRALRRPIDPQVQGARDWLLPALHSRPAKLFTYPIVALSIYSGNVFSLYFGDLLGALTCSHLGHLAMLGDASSPVICCSGCSSASAPAPRVPHPIMVIIHLVAMMAHGVFGLVLMLTTNVIAPPTGISLSLLHGRLLVGWPGTRGRHRPGVRRDPRHRRHDHPCSAVDPRRPARGGSARPCADRADRAEADGEEDDLTRYDVFLTAASPHRGVNRPGTARQRPRRGMGAAGNFLTVLTDYSTGRRQPGSPGLDGHEPPRTRNLHFRSE